MKAYYQIKSPNVATEIIQPLIEMKTESDKALQTIDSLVNWKIFIWFK